MMEAQNGDGKNCKYILQLNFNIIIAMEQAMGSQPFNILEVMTSIMRKFKHILHQLESQYRDLLNNRDIKDLKIQDCIAGLFKSVSFIELAHCKKMFCTRLLGRVSEIATVFRNRLAVSEALYWLRDYITAILDYIKEYQVLNQPSSLPTPKEYGTEFINLFDRICYILKRAAKEVRERTYKIKVFAPTTSSSIVLPQNTIRDKDKERRHSISEGPIINSMENKYKLTKQVINTVSLFAGMEVDVPYLRGLFLQARCNLAGVEDDRIDNNALTIKARNSYVEQYAQWKCKVRRKVSRRQKQGKAYHSSPKKMNSNKKNFENKDSDRSIDRIKSLARTTKMPKLFQNSEASGNSNEGERKREQLRNMQALTLNRQFIHLSQIKNQKVARRPYAEVKQVLVAGDEINYYSNKTQTPNMQPSKASFFMQRAVKNDKIMKRKSLMDNVRLVTEE